MRNGTIRIMTILLFMLFAAGVEAASVLVTLTNDAEPTADGWTRSDGNVLNNSTDLQIGTRGPIGGPLRSFGYVSFNHTIGVDAIPDGVRINMATLSIFQASCVGDPYGILGNLLVESLNFGAPPLTFAADAVPGTPITPSDVISTTCLGAPTTRSLDVRNAAQGVIDDPAVDRLQFRLLHENNVGTGSTNRDLVNATEVAAANERPRMEINYSPVRTLSATVAGTGSGTVTAPPDANGDGVNCPTDCTGMYFDGEFDGALITLTAAPAGASLFAGWTGCVDNPTPTTCRVNMDGDQNVSAQFDAPVRALTVNVLGGGTGTVTAPPDANGDGIDCPGDCSGTYADGASVTLTATPTAGSPFGGWTGCADNPTPTSCRVDMNSDLVVSAQFDPPALTRALTVTLGGTGTGTVTAAPDANGDGIGCPGDCTGTYADGAAVSLTATPDISSVFVGWTGCDSNPTPNVCAVTMAADRSVSASFNATSAARPIVPVPTLGVWPLLALSGVLGLAGLARARRPRR